MAVNQYPPNTGLFNPMMEELLRPLTGGGTHGMLRAPEADVVETDKEILVLMDVPGSTPGDIEIVLENNVLTVNGERRPRWSGNGGNGHNTFHLAERRYGRFSRSFILPRDVEQDQIQANFETGVLTITIPKSEKVRRRRIEIQNGSSREVGSGQEVH